MCHWRAISTKKKNEPTFDSFVVDSRSFIETKFPKCPIEKTSSALFFILAIQVTVSKEHVVNVTYLNHPRSVVRGKMNENQEFLFVFLFVAEPGGIENFQNFARLVEDT